MTTHHLSVAYWRGKPLTMVDKIEPGHIVDWNGYDRVVVDVLKGSTGHLRFLSFQKIVDPAATATYIRSEAVKAVRSIRGKITLKRVRDIP